MGLGTGMTPFDYAKLAGLGGYGVSKIAQGYNAYVNRRVPYNTVAGGTSRQVTRSSRGKRKRMSFARRVRNLAPYKHQTNADGTIGGNLTHNAIFTTSMTQKIVQGDTNQDRDGDSIYLVALRVKGAVHFPAASTGASMYRILVGWSGEEYNVSASTAGLSYAEIFQPNANIFVANAIVNPKAFTVLHDETIDINSLITTTAEVKTLDFKVPLNQKFSYQSAASVYGKLKNLYIVVIGSIVGGGAVTTGTFNFNTDTIFQNV